MAFPASPADGAVHTIGAKQWTWSAALGAWLASPQSAVFAGDTVAGAIAIATDTEQEAAASVNKAVSPGRQHRHPGHPKFWARVNGAGTSLLASYNVSGIVDTGAGRLTININVDFSSANWCCLCSIERPSTALTVTNTHHVTIRNGTLAAGSVEIECYDNTASSNVQEDPASYHVLGMGDQ